MIVAYSGGADSAYLAWAAQRALGDKAVAITADSASLPESHKADAETFAREHGIPFIVAAPTSTLDLSMPTAAEIPRDASMVLIAGPQAAHPHRAGRSPVHQQQGLLRLKLGVTSCNNNIRIGRMTQRPPDNLPAFAISFFRDTACVQNKNIRRLIGINNIKSAFSKLPA